jgi:integrase
LGLKGAALDLDAGTLTVREAIPTVYGKMFPSDRTKSEAGARTFRLRPDLVAVLRAHRTRQLEHRLLLGDRWTDHDLVCASEVGTAVYLTNLSRRFHVLCDRAGVRRIRLYDFRHTAASLMIASGVDLKAASEVLGHKDPTITQRVYQHVNADQRDRALSLLAGALADEEPPTVIEDDDSPRAATP